MYQESDKRYNKISGILQICYKPAALLLAVLGAAILIYSGDAFAIESEYDYDYQIDVSVFSNMETGNISSDTPSGTTAEIVTNGNTISINGYARTLRDNLIYADGVEMISLNSLQDILQCSVFYDPELYTAYIVHKKYSIRIALGSNLAVINNVYTENWDSNLINYNGVLYVPLNSLMETLWYTVDTSSGSVNIVTSTVEGYTYSYNNGVNVMYIDPLNIKAEPIINKSIESSGKANYSNSTFFGWEADGDTYSVGIIVSEGQVISDVITHGSPVTTLIVHYDGSVEIKRVSNIYEETNVLFAVSGCGVLPTVTSREEGFTGTFDIDRYTNRTYIGYNPDMDRIVLCVSTSTTLSRAGQVLSNLGCNAGLALDGGGSAGFGLANGTRFSSDGRKQYAVLYWD